MTRNNWVNLAYHCRIISQKEHPEKNSLLKVLILLLPLIHLTIRFLGILKSLKYCLIFFCSSHLFIHSFPTALKCMMRVAVPSLQSMLNSKIYTSVNRYSMRYFSPINPSVHHITYVIVYFPFMHSLCE